jgi:hypothetical protein
VTSTNASLDAIFGATYDDDMEMLYTFPDADEGY